MDALARASVPREGNVHRKPLIRIKFGPDFHSQAGLTKSSPDGQAIALWGCTVSLAGHLA
jgi:hypothetical protein